jgi:hypothetical protein
MMRLNILKLTVATICAIFLAGSIASAQTAPGVVTGETVAVPTAPTAQAAKTGNSPEFEYRVLMQNLFSFQSDSDFDSSEPIYNANGQSVGYLATYLRPDLTLYASKKVKLFYQFEIGINRWDRNDPDQEEEADDAHFVMKHRELYSELRSGDYTAKVGYQHFNDPTGLFINHWIGAVNLVADYKSWKASLVLGQLPDQNYEGFDLGSNNMTHDVLLVAAGAEISATNNLRVLPSITYLNDASIVYHTRQIAAPSVSLLYVADDLDLGLDLMYQYGMARKSGFDLTSEPVDAEISAWALQLSADYQPDDLGVKFNLLALSADDEYNRNDLDGSFQYSGKNRSSTIMLTEDELRDTGENFDEQMAETNGKFYAIAPGLLLIDVKAGYEVTDYFMPHLILGYGMVLEPKNALDESGIGLEADLDLEFSGEFATLDLIGGLLIPGAAASAFVNDIDREATDSIYKILAVLSVDFGG